jgi:DNA mismatch repair protein MutS2
MSSRALLDEARMSLNAMKNSFDDIEESLHDDLDTLQELEKSTKEKAKSAKQTAIETIAQGRPPEYWKPGMIVKSAKFREKGTVLKGADSKGNIECQFGIMKVKISYHELTPINENQTSLKNESFSKTKLFSKQKQNSKTKKIQNLQDSEIPPTLQHSGNTINLRGNTVDESLNKLDIELDKMNRMQVDRVVIIHGHGMGKVKESVRKHLEESSYKLRFRSGRQGEGGDGVTIVAFDD